MIYAIVAVDRNWGIGKDNGLLFHIREDMTRFIRLTSGKVVVCGENTLLSFPESKPLKNRSTIVLCKEGHEYEGCYCMHDFDELVKLLKTLSITQEVFIIGGGMLYRSMLHYCDGILATKIDAADPEATVFFPNLDEDPDFEIYHSEKLRAECGLELEFVDYENKSRGKA